MNAPAPGASAAGAADGLSSRSRRGERVEATHQRIARVGEQVAPLVHQAPEDLVEQRPARRIGRGGGLARELEELSRHPRAAGTGAGRRGRQRRAAASRHVTSAGGTSSCSSARATACHASKVGPTSTVLIAG